MPFDASHVLRFINRARGAMGLEALAELPFASAVRADERGCVLARALGSEVGGSDHPAWDGEFVLRLPDRKSGEGIRHVRVGESVGELARQLDTAPPVP